MSRRLASLVSLLACIGCIGLIPVASASAHAARPALCEHSCGGSWGAFEHAKATAEANTGQSASVEWCHNLGTNQKGVPQWKCQGFTANWKWEIELDPYGYTEYWHAVRY